MTGKFKIGEIRFVLTFAIMRRRAALLAPMVIGVACVGQAVADGVLQSVFRYILAAGIGVVLYGFLLDPAFLNDRGLKLGCREPKPSGGESKDCGATKGDA